MALKGAEQALFFDAFFIVLIGLYGIASGAGGPAISNLQNIPQPKLAPLPTTCTSLLCDNAFGDLVKATAYIGWAIVNAPVLVVYFLAIIIDFMSIVLGITFSPTFSQNGVPVLGFFFTAVQLIIAFEVFRIFRGSSSGF
jgi:hypothetical protein